MVHEDARATTSIAAVITMAAVLLRVSLHILLRWLSLVSLGAMRLLIAQ